MEHNKESINKEESELKNALSINNLELEDELTPISTDDLFKVKEKVEKIKHVEEQKEERVEEQKEEQKEEHKLEEAVEEIDSGANSLIELFIDKIIGIETGDIINAKIVDIKKTYILVDIGAKAEGVLEPTEIKNYNGEITAKVGDVIKVIVTGSDEESGQIYVSKKLAEQILAWGKLNAAYEAKTPISVIVTAVVKSGLIVDFGVPCFLPASQIDVRKIARLEDWLGKTIQVAILQVDKAKKRVIVSRRKLLEEEYEKRRIAAYQKIQIDTIVTGTVRNIANFGVFVDLDGVTSLIPLEEISWDKNASPDKFFKVGAKIDIKIINIDKENDKITLSRKQTLTNPWDVIDTLYPKGAKVNGIVENVTTFGAFVKIQEGLTGLIHISDMTWDNDKNKRPKDYLSEGQEITAVVLNYSKDEQKLSLGLKQLIADPWDEVGRKYPVGLRVYGKVTRLSKFGAFVRLDPSVEGLIHISDLSWEKRLRNPAEVVKVGDDIEVIILNVDKRNRRISLGYKQMIQSPFEKFAANHREGQTVTGKVISFAKFGAFVQIEQNIEGLIPTSQIDDKRVEKPDDVLKIGETVTVKIIGIDTENQKIKLSRKEYLKDLERKEVQQFMETEIKGGTNLGDLIKDIKIEPESEQGTVSSEQ